MGNKISSDDSYGFIIIETEKKTYFAGDQVNGQVHLNLKKTFPSNQINLIIKGSESAFLTERRTETRSVYRNGRYTTESYTRIYTHEGKNEFFGYTFPLYTQSGYDFNSGQYSFPFSFKLTDNLPGSFLSTWSEDGYTNHGKVEYTIYAGMKAKNNNKIMVFSQYNFYVDQKLAKSNINESSQYKKLSVYCRNKGNVKLNYAVDKSFFRVGENAEGRLIIDLSECKQKIHEIECNLTQHTSISVPKGYYHKSYKKKLNRKKIPFKDFEEIEKNKFRYYMSLPIDIDKNQVSMFSANIKNRFDLSMKLYAEGTTCYDDKPEACIPSNICNLVQERRKTDFGDVKWAPEVMNPYVCTLSNDMKMNDDMKNELDMNQTVNYPDM